MAWEPDRSSNFFFSPPAHLCAVTYMTEILLIVTLNNQFTLPYQLANLIVGKATHALFKATLSIGSTNTVIKSHI